MEIPETPSFVSKIVEELVSEGAESVWLIGSRANGTAREDSDWDLLAFLPHPPASYPVEQRGIDIILFGPDGRGIVRRYDGSGPSSNIEHWEWRRITEREAQYRGTKWRPFTEGELVAIGDNEVFDCRALLIWSRG